MDFLKNAAKTLVDETNSSSSSNNNSNNSNNNSNSNNNQTSENKENNNNNSSNNGNVADQIMGKLNNVLGGGEKGEQKEDILDKAIDIVQEKVFKAGPQDNESAAEQAKDKMIADAIRTGYKTVTGKEFPIDERK